jgi:hypothetical protein
MPVHQLVRWAVENGMQMTPFSLTGSLLSHAQRDCGNVTASFYSSRRSEKNAFSFPRGKCSQWDHCQTFELNAPRDPNGKIPNMFHQNTENTSGFAAEP